MTSATPGAGASVGARRVGRGDPDGVLRLGAERIASKSMRTSCRRFDFESIHLSFIGTFVPLIQTQLTPHKFMRFRLTPSLQTLLQNPDWGWKLPSIWLFLFIPTHALESAYQPGRWH